MSEKKKSIKEDYFYGIGVLIAKELNISSGYVRNVLNGKFPDRKTKSTRKIYELANKVMKENSKNKNET